MVSWRRFLSVGCRNVSNMSSGDREGVEEAFAALDSAVDGVLGLSFEALTTPERLVLLERVSGCAGGCPRWSIR